MGLYDWDVNNRIQFSIDLSEYNYDITPVPFMFKIDTNCGISNTNITYIFDLLAEAGSSSSNRKKIIFSQLVDGEEHALLSEIDTWDQVNRQAVLWVKPIELSCQRLNIFYLYFDKHHENSTYIADTVDRTNVPTLFMNTSFEGTYDTHGTLPLEILKIGPLYKLWYLGANPSSTLFSVMYCESTDLTTWVNKRQVIDRSFSYNVNGHFTGTILYENNLYKLWNTGTASSGVSRVIYRESQDGLVWTAGQMIIDIGQTPYSTSRNVGCAVLKDGTVYKMWYGGYTNNYAGVIYCTSTDGINWENHVRVISHTAIRSTDKEILPSKVVLINNEYCMYVTVKLVDGTTRIYTAKSTDGVEWYNFKTFSRLNNVTVIDTNSIGFLNSFYNEDTKKYIHHYGTIQNSRWITLQASSYFVDSLHTPASKVWGDHFNSVHHFNPLFFNIDSTINRLDVLDTNNISVATSVTSTNAINLLSNNSYVKFGNDSKYDIEEEGSIILFSKFTSGTDIVNKGTLADSNFSLYAQNFDPFVLDTLDDNFNGNDTDLPNPYLWNIAKGHPYINDNKLRMDILEETEVITTYYINGDADIRVNFKLADYDLDEWDSGIALKLSNGSYYKISIRYTGSSLAYYLEYKHAGGSWTVTGGTLTTDIEGTLRVLITDTRYYFFFWDTTTSDWKLQSSYNNTLVVSMQICIIRRLFNSSSANVTIDYTNFIITPENFRLIYNAEKSNTLALDTRSSLSSINNTLTFDKNVTEAPWTVYALSKSNELGANISLFDDLGTEISFSVPDLLPNTSDLYLGSFPYSTPNSIIGTVAEAWFANCYIDKNTTMFLGKSLKDAIISISKFYVEGYTTLYNKPISTKVLIYDSSTKSLVGVSQSRSSDGYYYIETPSSSECFMVAVSPDNYNYMIRGKIFPRVI